MKTLTITIELANDAFQQDPDAEVGRIFGRITDRIFEEPGFEGLADGGLRLRDVNGNTVGRATVEEIDPEPFEMPTECPQCGAAEIEGGYGGFDVGRRCALQTASCAACGAQWDEQYEAARIVVTDAGTTK